MVADDFKAHIFNENLILIRTIELETFAKLGRLL